MCIATTAQPTARTKPARTRRPTARLLLVIAGRSYRFWPHVFDRSLVSEQKHVLRDAKGRQFSVYEADIDFKEAMPYLVREMLPPHRYHCEACESGDCDHIAALVELDLL
jgi:hypothetical protein